MLNTSIKTMVAIGALVSIAGCKSTINSFVEDEIGKRVNETAGDRLFLVHGETTLDGSVQTASVSTDENGFVTKGATGSAQDGSVTLESNLGSNEGLIFKSGGRTTSLREEDGDDIEYDGGRRLTIAGISKNKRTRAYLGNEIALDFDHQSYGMWVTGIGTSNGRVSVGSFGHRTASADMPTNGAATYRGNSVGMVISPGGHDLVVESEVQLSTTDFSDLTIVSGNSTARHMEGSAPWGANDYNFAGTGTISGNGFTANLTGTGAKSAGATGSASGHFYGDDASEVGGTFDLNGSMTYTGAFGAERKN
ncbi:transferrin-binding protein-like solute binding protein [Rhodobacteraceae bacterium R_SAG9]|nr:transferrin-binding protein-like solute binding protein [Rhodobacteraceae bacterium R_SAG9]